MRLLVVFLLAATAIGPIVLPKSAVIVDVPSQRLEAGYDIGNVKVSFTDGHNEMWTKQGNCLMAHVSKSGIVGWVHFEKRNDRREPVDSVLRLCWPDEKYKDFRAPSYGPFIAQWDFVDQDRAVVIKTRAAHGPAFYRKYDLQTSEVIAQTKDFPGTALPEWARPFDD